MTSIRNARLVLIRLWQSEQIANYMIEASVPTMILFCVKSVKMLMIYINGRRFGPVAFISTRFRIRIRMGNLALMKATGLKRLPFTRGKKFLWNLI